MDGESEDIRENRYGEGDGDADPDSGFRQPPKKPDLLSTFKERLSIIQENAKRSAEAKKIKEAELKAIREEARRAGIKAREEIAKENVYQKEFEKEMNRKSFSEKVSGFTHTLAQVPQRMKESAARRAQSQGRPPPKAIPFVNHDQPQFNILGGGGTTLVHRHNPSYPSILGSSRSKQSSFSILGGGGKPKMPVLFGKQKRGKAFHL